MLLILAILSVRPASALGQGVVRELKGELASIEDGPEKPRLLAGVLVTIREFVRRQDDQRTWAISDPRFPLQPSPAKR